MEPDDPHGPVHPPRRLRRILRALRVVARLSVTLALGTGMALSGWWLLTSPDTPVPTEWNPLEPLDLSRPQVAVTGMKMRRALRSSAGCAAALRTGAVFEALPPREGPGQCGIVDRVRLTEVGGARLDPLETSCSVALRLAAWERYGLRPAAATLGAGVTRLYHQGSYNCRPIRGGTRLSTHATAEAVDIRAVGLDDGRILSLVSGWSAPGGIGGFWRAAHGAACEWFVTVLGPDYNRLHADHFHMQSVGWGACR